MVILQNHINFDHGKSDKFNFHTLVQNINKGDM